MGLINTSNESYYNGPDGILNSGDESYGSYQFTSIKDVINNFIVAYVGEDKIISKVKRTDVAFHAQRALQEFSFDILPSQKSIELELGPALEFYLPQDYVNYVRFSWVDENGVERIIYPTRNINDYKPALQANDYKYLYDQTGEILYAKESESSKRYKETKSAGYPEGLNELSTDQIFNMYRYGRRYGLSPEEAQANGNFYINPYKGIVHFSSNIAGKIISLKYISDGLAYDEDMVVHKFAEEAIYKYIAHAILASRANTPEYQIARFKKEMAAAKRNAKLRLSNLKIGELAQVMRNQSKVIKH
jgi:hypothetical protein